MFTECCAENSTAVSVCCSRTSFKLDIVGFFFSFFFRDARLGCVLMMPVLLLFPPHPSFLVLLDDVETMSSVHACIFRPAPSYKQPYFGTSTTTKTTATTILSFSVVVFSQLASRTIYGRLCRRESSTSVRATQQQVT